MKAREASASRAFSVVKPMEVRPSMAVTESATGGYADTARLISTISGHLVSRQTVWQWWHRRAKTGFPDGEMESRVAGRRKRRVFNTEEVASWWENHAIDHPVRFTPRPAAVMIGTGNQQEAGRDEER
jgi:hypothetical protein